MLIIISVALVCQSMKYIAIVSTYFTKENIDIYIELCLDNIIASLVLKIELKRVCDTKDLICFIKTFIGLSIFCLISIYILPYFYIFDIW